MAASSEGYEDHEFEYRHEGRRWSITIRARDMNDAQARLQALTWAKYSGRVVMTIPLAPSGPGPIARAWRSLISTIFGG